MAKPDDARRLTDAELAKLERRVARVYRQARDDLQRTVDDYFDSFQERDAEMKALIGTVRNGRTWTESDYKQWRLNQIARGKRFEALRDKMAERYANANETAMSYVNDATPGIYSLNRNRSAYVIDKATGGALTLGPDGETLNADFILYDEQTVRRLIVEEPDVMPYYPPERAVNRGIDLAYGKSQITKNVTSGILQGLSVKRMADALQERIQTMERNSAIRAARTAVTAAQNAGRMDSYRAAQNMGIKLKKRWLSTLDGRTRHSHRILDGETRETDEAFSNGCMYPGDPRGAPHETYNCRCTLIASLPDFNLSAGQRRAKGATADAEDKSPVVIADMTYSEWAGQVKKALANSVKSGIMQIGGLTGTTNTASRNGWVKPNLSAKRPIQNGFEAFAEGDILKSRIQLVSPEDGYFDVSMHGYSKGVAFGTVKASMTARELANVIRHDPNYSGQNIRLLSCNTGKAPDDGSYCVAEDLANALGVIVKAPDDLLYFKSDGSWYVGPFQKTELTEFSPNQRRRFK